MAQLVQKTFTQNGSIAIPAGVKNVEVVALRKDSQTNFSASNYPLAPPQQALANPGFIDAGGQLFMMGNNLNGEVGNSTIVPASSPTLVLGGLTAKKAMSSSGASFMIDALNNIYAWGINASGQLGINTSAAVSSPVLAVGGLKWAALGGLGGFCAVTETGLMYTAGRNDVGQLGDNSVTPRSSPTLVVGGLIWRPDPNCFNLANTGSGGQGWGITTAGVLYGWGSNGGGQIGDNTNLARSSPTLVLGGLTWMAAFQMGNSFTRFGITSTGLLYSWGQNQSGQQGTGGVVATSSPTLVIGGLTWGMASVFATGYTGLNVIGQTQAGVAYAWGANANGQLGVGDVTPRSSPTLVLGGLSFTKLLCGCTTSFQEFTLGLATNGQLYGWGSNQNGNLGVGDVAARSSPTLVVGGLTFTNFWASGVNGAVVAMDTSGRLYSWGGNVNGQLGQGDVVARSSPTLVLGGMVPFNQDSIVLNQIPVTPGTTYNITMNQMQAFFGPNPLGNGPFNQVIVKYWQ